MKLYCAGALVGFVGGALWALTLEQSTAWAADRYRKHSGPRSGW